MTDGPQVGRLRAPARRKTFSVGLAIASTVILVDQLTKNWAINTLGSGRRIHVVWLLQFNLTHNSGMAFSTGSRLGPFIGVLAAMVVVGMVISLRRVRSVVSLVATGLIIGGALGNIIDRLLRGDGWFRGSVIDFIDFQRWPIFNVADMCVMIGAAMLLFGASRTQRRVRASS
ncbi:MAG: signal peptidase II [Ilumatobacteraceae bacterium]